MLEITDEPQPPDFGLPPAITLIKISINYFNNQIKIFYYFNDHLNNSMT